MNSWYSASWLRFISCLAIIAQLLAQAIQDAKTVAMAALHNGQQYLIEKYSVASTPGLQLLKLRSLNQLRLRSLTVPILQCAFATEL